MKYLRKLAVGMLALMVTVAIGGSTLSVEAAPKAQQQVAAPAYAVDSQFGLFDWEYYLKENPDVAAVYGNDPVGAYYHFVNFGSKEGRNVSPLIDLAEYGRLNPDVVAVYGNDPFAWWQHYNQFGVNETGRTGGVLFNAKKYAEAYPEVVALVGNNPAALAQHFVSSGRASGKTDGVLKYDASHNYAAQTSGGGGGSGSSGGSSSSSSSNGGSSSGTTKPSNPTVDPGVSGNDPVGPEEPAHTKASAHTKDDFEGGVCKQGCGLTLKEFQDACTVDHTKVDKGTQCPTCGAEGEKEGHDATSVHTKDDFDASTGKCTIDENCTLTLTQFQDACEHKTWTDSVCDNCGKTCPDMATHANNYVGQSCSTCGTAGEKKYASADCPDAAEHANHGSDWTCPKCDTAGTKPAHEQADCPNKATLKVDETCNVCGAAGEAKYTEAECPDKAEHANHGSDWTCPKCDTVGTKPAHEQADCPNKATLKVDKTCDVCGAAGEAKYEQGSCPDKDSHEAGTACDKCDYAG